MRKQNLPQNSLILVIIFVLSLSSTLGKTPEWSTLLSSSRERGNVIEVLPRYTAGKDSHLIVAFDGDTILDYDIVTDRVHFMQYEKSEPFSSNISSFGYLADLDVYYVGTQGGDIWQMVPASKTVNSWERVISNTSFAPISLILPFMRGGFFDLYFAAGDGELLQFNTFFNFGHQVYGDISTGVATLALYCDYGINGETRSLISGYSNGAIVKTTVGDGGSPVTDILQAIGTKITAMKVYSNQEQTLLIVGTGGTKAHVSIYDLIDNSLVYETPFYATAIQALEIYSDLIIQEDYLVFGLADGTILSFQLSNLSDYPSPAIETLASSELFGGFPITALKYNWLSDSTGVLFAATEYGTVSALLNNNTDWMMLATPLSWEIPQHILDLQFIPTTDTTVMLTAILDQGEIAMLENQQWVLLTARPSQTETRFQKLLRTSLIQEHRSYHPIKYASTGPVSFPFLRALIDNNVNFNLIMTCLDASCSPNPFPLLVEGYELYSQEWRQDGLTVIVTNSLSGQRQAVLYASLFNLNMTGDSYVWTQTVFT